MCYHDHKMENKMLETPLISKAKLWAQTHHADHTYGNESFFDGHLEKVAQKVAQYNPDDEHLIAAAYLHDIVEDTDITLETVREEFGFEVANIVGLCTDPKDPTLNRREKKELLYAKFAAFDGDADKKGAAIVKSADRIVNHSKSSGSINVPKMSMYLKEFPDFMATFGPSLLEAGWRLGWDELLAQYVRLNKLVDAYR